MGALNTGGGQLMSYLLFQDSYTRELIALGYQDAMKRSDDLLAFLGGFTVDSTGATRIMRRLSPHVRNSVPRPSSDANPTVSVTVVSTTPPASAGSIPSRSQDQRHADPGERGGEQVDHQRREDDQRRSSTC